MPKSIYDSALLSRVEYDTLSYIYDDEWSKKMVMSQTDNLLYTYDGDDVWITQTDDLVYVSDDDSTPQAVNRVHTFEENNTQRMGA